MREILFLTKLKFYCFPRMLPMELYRMIRNVLYVDIVLDDNKATPSIEEMVKIRQEQLEKNRKASLNSN